MQISDMRLAAEDFSVFSPRFVSSQVIYSPTSPKAPACTAGWRDRWWLHGTPAQQVAISYWIFANDTDAQTAAEAGRWRLSARTVLVNYRHESIYRPLADDSLKVQQAWQADANVLFVHMNVVVLVAAYGNQVSRETTHFIAKQIIGKMAQSCGR